MITNELACLLQMDGEVFPMDNGYWTKFEIRKVEPTAATPHGIRYSLTLHNSKNERVFGIDNAHLPKLRRKRYGAKKITWDHQHKEKVSDYEFDSPGRLLEDFWKEVDKIIAD